MGTVTQITAGETQGCVGCHEHRFRAPSLQTSRTRSSSPVSITPPPWGAGPVDFVKQVQPVLDRYCVSCHEGAQPKGNIDLSGDKTRLFNMAFETLVFTPGLVERYHINRGPTGNFPALGSGSYVSRLTQLIATNHAAVVVDDDSRRRIYTWIDANVPYYGTWDMTRPHSFGGRDTWRGAGLKPQPWFSEFIQAYEASGIREPLDSLRNADINLTRSQFSRVLLRNLARSAGGWQADKRAVFSSPADQKYQSLLAAIEKGREALLARPRMDMPGAVPVPQERDFGRTF